MAINEENINAAMEYLISLCKGRTDFLSIAELEKIIPIWHSEFCLSTEEIEELMRRFKARLRPLPPELEEAMMDLIRIKIMEDLIDHALGLARFVDQVHEDIQMMLSRMKLLQDNSKLQEAAIYHSQDFMYAVREACKILSGPAKAYAMYLSSRAPR